MDSERGRGEEELRREAAERPATDPSRVDPVGDAADDAWTATPRREMHVGHFVGTENVAKIQLPASYKAPSYGAQPVRARE